MSLAPFTPSPCHTREWLSLFDSTFSALYFSAFLLSVPFFHCEGEVIVQGDEGPVCGVAQVVDCHGVTVGHQEREEEEEQQEEAEGDGEELKEHCACPWMG